MITRILIILALLLLLPAFVLGKLLSGRRHSLRNRILWALPNIILLAALCIVSFHESYSMSADTTKAILLSLTLIVSIPEFLLSLFLLISRIFRQKSVLRRIFSGIGWTLFCIALAILLAGFTYGSQHVITKEFTVQSASVPKSFEGYVVTHISDLHLGTQRLRHEVVRKIVEEVNATKPDLIVFTGDLVNYRAEEMLEFEDILRGLKSKDGIVAVMGNHDYMEYYRWGSEEEHRANIDLLQSHEKALGWTLLLNENLIIRHGNDSICIVGLENHGNRPSFPKLANLPQAEKGLQEGSFRILLQHDPTYWRSHIVGKTTYPLMLAGHTHAMQFQIGKWSPASWFYDEWGGMYTSESAQQLLVSPGVGEVMLPFRFGAWPEVEKITLRSK